VNETVFCRLSFWVSAVLVGFRFNVLTWIRSFPCLSVAQHLVFRCELFDNGQQVQSKDGPPFELLTSGRLLRYMYVAYIIVSQKQFMNLDWAVA
jgi:hypothetical protein